ncbi:MAG: hypothetical protein JO297_08835 [Nitrososphaeraceae archaeon]|nr:hypothetical protein [Nitrososphaeraceae archaeon]
MDEIIQPLTIRFLILAGLLFSASAVANTNNAIAAYAQSYNNNNAVFLDNGPNTDRPPAFLDAFWTNNLSANSSVPSNSVAKTEVGPGDGVATLAVVLVNRGRSDLTGVTGYLNLPAGFKPLPGKNNGTSQSVAGFYSVVKAGNTFILYFDMNVLKQAKVGGYSTPLTLQFSKINQMGQLTTTITIPFRLTGRVILNTVSENKELIPGSPNVLKVNIQNKGTADATGVVATITSVTGSSTTAGSISTSSSPTSTGSSNTTSTQQQPSSSPASPSSSSSIPTVNVGSQTFNLGRIPTNGSAEINPIVYPTSSAGETAQNLNLQISYGDAYGNQKVLNAIVGLIIAPNPPQSVLNLTTNNGNALILTAGKIENMEFTLQNNDKNPITSVVASLNSQTDAMKILGDSRWTLQSMSPQSKLNMFTKVFASSTLVGQPTLLTLTVQYVSQGQSKTDSLNLGAYITGEIRVRVYDVRITNVGNIPNLTGNILNEGNTVGLFTTVQIVNNQQQTSSSSAAPSNSGGTRQHHGQQQEHNIAGSNQSQGSLADFINPLPPPQYLGDLSVDSPLPFSIPLTSNNKTITAPPGNYPVALKISYSDDLKIPHQFVDTNHTVTLQSLSQSGGREHGGGGFAGLGTILTGGQREGAGNNISGIIMIGAIVAAIAIAALYIIRRRRSRSKIVGLQANRVMNEDTFLDDIAADKDITRSDAVGSRKDR